MPVGEVALALGCLLGKVFGGFGGFWRVFGGFCVWGFGGFGGFWRVWSGLGPGVPAGDGVWRVWRVLEGLEGLEGFGMFGAFAGWQTVALKAHRKLCCGLGPGVPVGEVALALGCLLGRGVWRVWRVLEGLEGFGGCLEGGGFGGFGGFWRVFGGFGGFWRVLGFGAFAGWQTAALKAHRKPLLWPWPWGACSGSGLGPGVPAGDGVWRVLEGFGGFGGFGMFGAFAGWQTAALKAHRKPLLWPWPWGACSGSGLGPGVPAGDGVWRVWKVLEGFLEGFGRFGAFAGGQTAALKAHRKPLLWPWPWGACWGSGLGPGVPAGEGVWRVLEGVWRVFGGFGRFWRVFGGFGGFWRVWSVCGLANGSFESQ